ncbi:MAG: lamin tail domain-containing protein [Verrucomicrobia bacterium]|nr:lamin tail domain-containing protein [Verrucomicrobiota bacterium]
MRRFKWSELACAALLLVGTGVRGDVRINEFLADNGGSLLTADGQASDWIELFNSGTNTVDLSGWYLTDRVATPTRWRIPDGTRIAAGGYLVIFADTSSVSITNGDLHASFSLAREGEYLALVRPDGVTVADAFTPQFPPQLRDISYGRASRETELLGAGAAGRYRVPDAAGTAPWQPTVGALGFTGTNAAFTVSYYEVTSAMANVDVAEQRVTNRATWRTDRPYPIIEQHAVINFHANGGNGFFGEDAPFPGHAFIGEDRSNFIVVSEGSIYVPAAGEWTFAVGSDDGFRLRISGHGADFVSEFPSPRGFATTLATFNFPAAGSYALSLIFYENGGAASLELSAAPGFHAAVSPDVFRLVGDPEGGLLHAGAIGSFIETDVAATMWNVNARLDAEWFFNVPQLPEPEDTLVLSVRCADGFAASLNGTPLAALNVPAPLLWNSAATTARTTVEALQWVEVPVPVATLVAGTNTLAITALNDAVGDTEFLIQPRLVRRPAILGNYYFKTPTPGGPNGQPFNAPTPSVAIQPPRGFKTAPFTATLTAEGGAGPIRYTLDGSVPGPDSPVYEGPLTISATTVLRAAVVDPQAVRQNVATVSWLFLEDILQQGPTPPPGWPANRAVNNHVMEYGLRPEIVTSDPVRLRAALTNAIPSISLVTDLENLFSPQRGIYVNPGNDGRAWERPVSVELIDPVRGATAEFQMDAGLRIRGAFSRSANNPKHALRLFFRSEYGEGRLRFPLFDDEGAASFDKVDLRASMNYSWAYENSDRETFIRETFSRDSQRDMGMPYTRSRYYHLYLNGQYWGLYQTQERGDAGYAATYLGGASEDWDCIKTTQPGYVTTASDGTFDAFHALHHIALNEGFVGNFASNYQRVKGRNPDGSPNPAYPVYLDGDNLIVFMLIAYYTGDPDSPVSIWGGFPNNMYGLFNRVSPTGFKWLRHDAEHSLGAHGGYPVTTDTTFAGANFTSQGQFNPATLHQRLAAHPDYRRRFADLVQKHFYGDGALTPTNAQRRFQSRMKEIDLAIIGESARWGRGKTREGHWLPACNAVLNYLSQRRDIIVGHFRRRGWFPGLDAPAYSVQNTEVPRGQIVRVSAPGTFYFTVNGSDPRLPDGAINPAAIAVTSSTPPTGPRTLIPRGAVWRYHDAGAEPAAAGGLTWRDPGYPAGGWAAGPAVLGFAGASTVNPVATQTRRYVSGNSGPQVTTTYFRHEFTLDATNSRPDLVLEILRDDGAVLYLNGVEILRENMPDGPITYDTWSASVVSSPDQNTYFTRTVNVAQFLRVGVNTLAAEVHQCNATSSDLYFDLSLTLPGETASVFTDLVVTNDLHLLARAFDGSEWSALAENLLTIERPPMDYAKLRVTELMYAPPAPPPGGPYINDDFAWLELQNTGSAPLDLEGVRFVTGITHTFAPFVLAPGARLVLAKNPAAFATRHPTNNLNLVAWTGGNLARSGETLALVTPAGSNILTFAYSRFWYPETFNTGRTLVAVDVTAPEPAWSTPENWRPSHVATGTPGGPDAPVLASGRLTPEGRLLLDTQSLDGLIELWVSADLEQWSRCDPEAWTRDGATLSVNLDHPSLPADGRAFFRIRLSD